MAVKYLTSTARSGGLAADYQLADANSSSSMLACTHNDGINFDLCYYQARVVRVASNGITVVQTVKDWFSIGTRAGVAGGIQTSAEQTLAAYTVAATEYLAVQLRTSVNGSVWSNSGWFTQPQGDNTQFATVTVSAYTVAIFDDSEGDYSEADIYVGDTTHASKAVFTAAGEAAPGTMTMGTPTIDDYGLVTVTATEGSGGSVSSVLLQRSIGGAYHDAVLLDTASKSGSVWTFHERTPNFGTYPVHLGDSLTYKATATGPGGTSSASAASSAVVCSVDSAAQIANQIALVAARYGIKAQEDVTTYSAEPMLSRAEWYRLTASSTALAAVSDQWDLVQSLIGEDGVLRNNGAYSTETPALDHHGRGAWQVLQTAHLLESAGESTYSAEMRAIVEGLAGVLWSVFTPRAIGPYTINGTSRTWTTFQPPIAGGASVDAPNQNLWACAFLCMLYNDTASAFYHDSRLEAPVKAAIDFASYCQESDGSIPWSITDAYYNVKNSNYHMASLSALSIIQREMGEEWYATLDTVVTAALGAPQTLWSTEPVLGVWENDTSATNGWAYHEMGYRVQLYAMYGITDPLAGVMYSRIWNDSDGEPLFTALYEPDDQVTDGHIGEGALLLSMAYGAVADMPATLEVTLASDGTATWPAADRATGYNVRWTANGTTGDVTDLGDVLTASYGEMYGVHTLACEVQAYNASGTSAWAESGTIALIVASVSDASANALASTPLTDSRIDASVAEATADAPVPVPGMATTAQAVAADASAGALTGISITGTETFLDTFAYATVAEAEADFPEPSFTSASRVSSAVSSAGADALNPAADWVLSTANAICAEAAGVAMPPQTSQIVTSYVFAVIAEALSEAFDGLAVTDVPIVVYAYAVVAEAASDALAPISPTPSIAPAPARKPLKPIIKAHGHVPLPVPAKSKPRKPLIVRSKPKQR